MSYRNVIVFFWLTFHLCFLPRLEILLSCCFVRDLAVALIGAWQCLLKDTTNCVRRKSKLICYYTHIYPSLPHFHPLQPTSTPELPLVERKGELSVVSTNLPYGLFFLDLQERRDFGYGRIMYQVLQLCLFRTKNSLER